MGIGVFMCLALSVQKKNTKSTILWASDFLLPMCSPFKQSHKECTQLSNVPQKCPMCPDYPQIFNNKKSAGKKKSWRFDWYIKTLLYTSIMKGKKYGWSGKILRMQK